MSSTSLSLRRQACGLVLLGAAAIASTANAQFPVPMGYPMMAPPMGMPAYPMSPQTMNPQTRNPISALNLTPEQREQMTEIGAQARAKSVAVMNQIGDNFKALRELFAATVPDPEAIGAAYGEIFTLQRQTIEAAIGTYNQQVDVLTPEQRQKWEALRQHLLTRFAPPAAPGQ